MEDQQNQKTPSNITARFSIDLTDKDDPIIAARIKVDGQEASLPIYMVLGGLVVTKGLSDPDVRAAYARTLFSAAQALALGLLAEAKIIEVTPGDQEPAAGVNLDLTA